MSVMLILSGASAPVSVYALHPGLVRTDFFRHYPCYQRWVMTAISWLISKESWYGAQTSIYCAVDESLESETGKYYRSITGFSFVFYTSLFRHKAAH